MEILDNFGFEPVFFTAQIINFLILFLIFKKFLYKPILTLLKERSDSIAKGLLDAENAKKALEEAELKKDKIIAEAALSAEQIINETRTNVESLRDEILAKSKLDAEKIIIQAQETAMLELEKSQKEAHDISINLARKVLDRVLNEFFTREEKQRIFTRNIKTLDKI